MQPLGHQGPVTEAGLLHGLVGGDGLVGQSRRHQAQVGLGEGLLIAIQLQTLTGDEVPGKRVVGVQVIGLLGFDVVGDPLLLELLLLQPGGLGSVLADLLGLFLPQRLCPFPGQLLVLLELLLGFLPGDTCPLVPGVDGVLGGDPGLGGNRQRVIGPRQRVLVNRVGPVGVIAIAIGFSLVFGLGASV